jgi:hypothetical protein
MLHLWLIILLAGGDVPVNSETLLVTDFVNLKIKSVQSFRGVYRDSMCVHMFIGVNDYTCIWLYCIFKKNILTPSNISDDRFLQFANQRM